LGNYKTFLNEQEFAAVNVPTESFMKVCNVRIYKNERDKAKIDFDWSGVGSRILGVSMTDQDFYDKINVGDVNFKNAYIVTAIPKKLIGLIQILVKNKHINL
jgi:hypothetical protein